MSHKHPYVTVSRLTSCLSRTRRIEFSGQRADRGGFVTFTEYEDNMVVDLHRLDPEVEVWVAPEKLGRRKVNYNAKTGDAVHYDGKNWLVVAAEPTAVKMVCADYDGIGNITAEYFHYDQLKEAGAYYLI